MSRNVTTGPTGEVHDVSDPDFGHGQERRPALDLNVSGDRFVWVDDVDQSGGWLEW